MFETADGDERAVGAAKREFRRRLAATRAGLSPADRAAATRTVLANLLSCHEIGAARVLACYISIGFEPGTGALIDRLLDAGVRVLLPVLLDDNDLDWAAHDGSFDTGRYGLPEPAGHRLGVAAIGSADVVVVPALAVDQHGLRLGRGGGSYDRALARTSPLAWTVTPLYDGEVLDRVPAEPHDARVHAAVTPGGTHRFRGDGDAA